MLPRPPHRRHKTLRRDGRLRLRRPRSAGGKGCVSPRRARKARRARLRCRRQSADRLQRNGVSLVRLRRDGPARNGDDHRLRRRCSQFPVSSFEFPVSYSRDAGGLVTNLVYAPGKAVARAYDADGRLVSVSDWLGHTWTFAHDGAGKPTGGASPDGTVHAFTYDAAGRLAGWSAGSLAGRAITRDVAGRRIRDTVVAGPMPTSQRERHAENAFDAADRLVAASVRYGSHTNAAVSETYQYDGNGALTVAHCDEQGSVFALPKAIRNGGWTTGAIPA